MWHHLAGQVERCDECRFDGSAYTVDDVSGTLRNLAEWAGHAMGGIDGFRVPGMFGSEVACPGAAPAHVRLLAYVGRQPVLV